MNNNKIGNLLRVMEWMQRFDVLNTPRTAGRVGVLAGMSRATAYRYFKRMSEERLIEEFEQRGCSDKEKHYRLTASGVEWLDAWLQI